MSKKMNVILILVLFVVLMTAAYVVYNMAGADSDGAGVRDEVAATDFTVYDQSGHEVKLSDFRGRPVVLNFWASWCGPCRSEMPAFDKALYASFGSFSFITLSLKTFLPNISEILFMVHHSFIFEL